MGKNKYLKLSKKIEKWSNSDKTETLQDYLGLNDKDYLELMCKLKKKDTDFYSQSYDENNVVNKYENIVFVSKKTKFRKVIVL